MIRLVSLLLCLTFSSGYAAGDWASDKWTPPFPVSQGLGRSNTPVISSWGDDLVVVWSDDRFGRLNLFWRIKRSGESDWQPEEVIADTPFNSVKPAITADYRNVYLVWEESSTPTRVMFSSFDGDEWLPPRSISQPEMDAISPQISVIKRTPDSIIFVYWVRRESGRRSIVYITSDDEGRTWSHPTPIEYSNLDQHSPDAASGITSTYVTWVEGAEAQSVIKLKKLGNPATDRTWVLSEPGFNGQPSVSVSEPYLMVAWQRSNDVDEPMQIATIMSDNYGDSWTARQILTGGLAESISASTALTPSHALIVWQSGGGSGWQIIGKAKKLNAIVWDDLGALATGIEPYLFVTPVSDTSQTHLCWTSVSSDDRSTITYRCSDTIPPPPPGKPTHFDSTARTGTDDDGVLSFRWDKVPDAVRYELFLSSDGGDFTAVGSTADIAAEIPVNTGRSYRLKILSVDEVGNKSALSPASDPVFVDSEPPATSIEFPTDGATVNGKITILFKCQDDNLTECVLSWGEGRSPRTWNNLFSTKFAGEMRYEWDTSSFEGFYTLRLSATDEVGHISQTFVRLRIDNTPPDPISPGDVYRYVPDDDRSAYRDPSFSPDGNWLAYSSNESGVWDIWIVDLDSLAKWDLTHDTDIDRKPQWSPDGSRIIYQSLAGDNWDVKVVELQSNNVTILVGTPSNEVDPSWSPTGTMVAYASDEDGDYEINAINIANGRRMQLTDNDWNDRAPTWHPSELFIAYQSDRRGEWDIVRLSMGETGDVEELTSTAVDETEVRWSPDGKRLLYQTTISNGDSGIMALDLVRLSTSRISPQGMIASNPSWSFDGKSVACQVDRGIALIELNSSESNIEARITSPSPGDSVEGKIEIIGVARGSSFESYVIEASSDEINWMRIENPSTSPVREENFLGLWDVSKLAGKWWLRLTASTTDGESASHKIWVNVRNEAPELIVIHPVSGEVTDQREIDVLCRAAPESRVWINDSLASGDGNEFTGKVWLSEGVNEIICRAETPEGESVSVTTRVWLDTTSPEIQIAAPSSFEKIETPFTEIRGSVNEETEITIGSVPIGRFVPGQQFIYPVSLQEGVNEFVIEATDVVGLIDTERLRIIYEKPDVVLRDETPPAVVDPFPANGSILRETSVTISVTIIDDVELNRDSLVVHFDGQEIDDHDYEFDPETGRFAYQIPELTDGDHRLTISVADTAGNELSNSELSFTVDTTPVITSVWAERQGNSLRLFTAVDGAGRKPATLNVIESERDYGYSVELDADGTGLLTIAPSQRSFRLIGRAQSPYGTDDIFEGYFAYARLSDLETTSLSVGGYARLLLPAGDGNIEVTLRSQEVDQDVSPTISILQYSNAANRDLKIVSPVCEILASRDVSEFGMNLSLTIPDSAARVAMFRWDERSQSWYPVDADKDLVSETLSADIRIPGPSQHLGRYALLLDDEPPQIEMTSPGDGGIVSSENFLVIVTVTDRGSGISETAVEVDGIPRASTFRRTENRLYYLPSDLGEGIHRIVISATDRAGNKSVREFRFFVDGFFGFAEMPFAYPNPCNEKAHISVAVSKSSNLTLCIYDISGNMLFTDGKVNTSQAEFIWDLRNLAGKPVSPGVYLFTVEAERNGRSITGRGKIAVVSGQR